ncbi:MAG: hypothetical protein HYV63_18475 [Candidatus Schekmanbacteria bacterium]|nr:hypothetical protein [Candidatus Schekmanbacteria bacterium]
MAKLGTCAFLALLGALLSAASSALSETPPEISVKLEAVAQELRWMSTDQRVVVAVREHNLTPPPATAEMTEERWRSLTILDPIVRGLAKNSLAQYLKTRRDERISELFVSGADGAKVAFFGKTTSWSHRGKEKHEVPMRGKVWFGAVELDESAGVEQIQIGLPVLDQGKPIGSIVVGVAISKLH